jgi:hypothetical protein
VSADEALARRAVAAGFVRIHAAGHFYRDFRGALWKFEDPLPDLADAATTGVLLALVREAWGDPRLVAIYCEAANPGQSEGWAVQCADNRLPLAGEHLTEAEALVAALEAAPRRAIA